MGDHEEIEPSPTKPAPVWIVCGGVGAQWPGMLRGISQHPLCKTILEELTQLLAFHSFDLDKLINHDDLKLFDDPKNLFIGLATVQCLQVGLS